MGLEYRSALCFQIQMNLTINNTSTINKSTIHIVYFIKLRLIYIASDGKVKLCPKYKENFIFSLFR